LTREKWQFRTIYDGSNARWTSPPFRDYRVYLEVPVELTRRPQPDPTIRLVTVFETEDVGVAAVATSLLEDAGIDHAVRGDTLRNVLGWGGSSFFHAAGPVRFEVREEDAERATALLAQLKPRTDLG
jgi:Putative prokaryotic signal transducing protein